MLLYGSVCAMIVSALLYRIPRRNWSIIFEKILCEFKYNALAMTEIFFDWVYAKRNKIDKSPQTGRIAIVTGGSRGIGLRVVKTLLELDMDVIIACRTPSAGHKAILEIRESGIKTGKACVYVLDNSSLKSVKNFAEQVKQNYEKLHILINNAGIMFCPYEETEDGFEQQWATNYLSHFLLTSLLLPLLRAGGLPDRCSRVVNVSSCAHLLGKINFDDINHKHRFITGIAYAQSKLAQVIFTKHLQDILRENEFNVQMYSVHPGVVHTELFAHSHIWKFRQFLYYILKTPEQGAIPILYTALSKDIENHGGVYINNCRESVMHSDASNPLIQRQLLQLSLQQVKLTHFFQYC